MWRVSSKQTKFERLIYNPMKEADVIYEAAMNHATEMFNKNSHKTFGLSENGKIEILVLGDDSVCRNEIVFSLEKAISDGVEDCDDEEVHTFVKELRRIADNVEKGKYRR